MGLLGYCSLIGRDASGYAPTTPHRRAIPQITAHQDQAAVSVGGGAPSRPHRVLRVVRLEREKVADHLHPSRELPQGLCALPIIFKATPRCASRTTQDENVVAYARRASIKVELTLVP